MKCQNCNFKSQDNRDFPDGKHCESCYTSIQECISEGIDFYDGVGK